MPRLSESAIEAPSLLASSSRSVDAASEANNNGGFSQVLELMRACGRPAVGHSAMFDLVYALQSFTLPPPPDRWLGFKPLATVWFPGGLFDTKLMAFDLLQRSKKPGLFGRLKLEDIYKALLPGGPVETFLAPRHRHHHLASDSRPTAAAAAGSEDVFRSASVPSAEGDPSNAITTRISSGSKVGGLTSPVYSFINCHRPLDRHHSSSTPLLDS